jgi:hypothetical protein
MNRLLIAVTVAATSSLITLAPPPAHAAMLTNGGNFPYGGEVCADAGGLNFTPGTAVVLHGCHGYVNQQWVLELGQIFSYGQFQGQTVCLQEAGTAPGSVVVISLCGTQPPKQEWYIGFVGTSGKGRIKNAASGLCLDGTTGAVVVNICTTSGLSQQWEIK